MIQLRKKKNAMAEVYTSSFNDIMFFLMLFFLIASTLISPSVVKLTLPNSKYHQTIRKTEIALSVTKDLQYFVNKQQVSFDQLENVLLTATAGKTEPIIVLRVDNTIPVQNLVDVLQIGNKINVRMILATKAPNG
ncbi:MAG TPA: biopolymer transporter ExbD [Bacteroidales bacterium]|jgi:biopolymer transport protein ExbD|nr:biopolymer transporter ExbD [Bacteroidales bacterium]